jgi:hypothetical protein
MAAKKNSKAAGAKNGRAIAGTTPKFPYTTKPASLRRLLKEIPKKPKPTKFDMDLLRSWGFADANDYSMLRVLKPINLLNDKNEPTEIYSRFMNIDEGGKVLAPEIKRVYAPLFQASHTPYSETNEKLRNLFNIHSGGGDRSLDQQVQTFKALCENTSFDSMPTVVSTGAVGASAHLGAVEGALRGTEGGSNPTININLHIHLPENKSRRDYEDIIEDIGRYIFGRNTGERRE